MKTYLGIDNGCSGSVAILNDTTCVFIETPIKHEQSYTKKVREIARIDYPKLYNFLYSFKDFSPIIYMERPCVNPGRFTTTLSAMRAFEATTIVIENLGLTVQETIDSKRWQHKLLPGIKGSPNLKKASMELGIELFPQHKDLIIKHKDADALLIAEWARRNNL